MPSFKHLSQEDLRALIAFLKSRKNPEMKQVEEEKWSE
jgi:cytochrome c1